MLKIQNEPIKTPNKIYAFDFDGTLVTQKSSAKFPKDSDDWKPLFENTKEKLKKLHEEGWTIVIFTNQGGVEKKKITLETVKQRLTNFLNFVNGDSSGILNIPITVYASLKYNNTRKPHTKMFKQMIEDFGIQDLYNEFKGDHTRFVYVGDAAGRFESFSTTKKKKKDISCSDLKFANNVGINFQTEQAFFQDHNMDNDEWEWGSFNPDEYVFEEYVEILPKKEKEMILLIGPQASGKSTFSRNFTEKYKNYSIVNQDTLGTKAKCLKLAKDTMMKGKNSGGITPSNLIIDNTNSDINTRKLYVEMAREYGYYVRYIWFDINKEMAEHLDEMRVELDKSGTRETMSSIAFNIYFKNLRENPPSLQECDELVKLGWNVKEEDVPPEFFFRY